MGSIFGGTPKPDTSIQKETLALQKKQADEAKAREAKLTAQEQAASRAKGGGRKALLYGDELGVKGATTLG